MVPVYLALFMSLSVAIPASAADFAAFQEAEYYAIVEEINTLYDAKITLYSVPEDMIVVLLWSFQQLETLQ